MRNVGLVIFDKSGKKKVMLVDGTFGDHKIVIQIAHCSQVTKFKGSPQNTPGFGFGVLAWWCAQFRVDRLPSGDSVPGEARCKQSPASQYWRMYRARDYQLNTEF